MTPPYLMDQPKFYRIKVRGKLDQSWSSYFDDLKIHIEVDCDQTWVTSLSGHLIDQAALQGTLQKLYALGLPLISVESVDDSNFHPP